MGVALKLNIHCGVACSSQANASEPMIFPRKCIQYQSWRPLMFQEDLNKDRSRGCPKPSFEDSFVNLRAPNNAYGFPYGRTP